MRLLSRVLTAAALLSASTAMADAPSPEHVKNLWDFYFSGQGKGVVLVDTVACLKVGKEGENRAECEEPVPAEGVKAGTTVLIWQAYLLPQGDEVEDLVVQVKLGDQVRETKDVSKVKGQSIRQRTWTGVTLRKPGNYTFNIMRGDQVLKSLTVTAN